MTRKFLILVHGENYLFQEGNVLTRKGFYVTRCVEAVDAESAQEIALDMVRADETLANIENDESNTPWLSIDEVGEVDDWGDLNPPGSGFAFFIEEDEN